MITPEINRVQPAQKTSYAQVPEVSKLIPALNDSSIQMNQNDSQLDQSSAIMINQSGFMDQDSIPNHVDLTDPVDKLESQASF